MEVVTFPNGKTYLESNLLVYSDYSGDSVERSNVAVLRREHECRDSVAYRDISPGWIEFLEIARCPDSDVCDVYGNYGTDGVILLDTPENRELIESLESGYPVIDESDLSECEFEAYDAAWNDWVQSDLMGFLPEWLADSLEYADSDALRSVWDLSLDASGGEWIVETGGNAWPHGWWSMVPQYVFCCEVRRQALDAGLEPESY